MQSIKSQLLSSGIVKVTGTYAKECNISWDQFRREEAIAAREQWEAHAQRKAGIFAKRSIREQLIRTGQIVPYTAPVVLEMDAEGHRMAQVHMDQDYDAWQEDTLCEIPLDQVPEHVLDEWERREKVAAQDAARVN